MEEHALMSHDRLKTPASVCRTNFKSKVFSGRSNKRTLWLLELGL